MSSNKDKIWKKIKSPMGVLKHPHSNAAWERIFWLVSKNKTGFRRYLKPEKLEAFLVAQSRINYPWYKQTYDRFLRESKSFTHKSLS